MDIADEREDLKEAAEQSLNVILDLGLDGVVRWLSPTWRDVIGTPIEEVQGKPIADILIGEKDIFINAVESMQKDDSRSHIVRFSVRMGSASVLQHRLSSDDSATADGDVLNGELAPDNQTLDLEGQGIMVYDRSSSNESHVSALRPPLYPTHVLTLC